MSTSDNRGGLSARFLDVIEFVGNKLPDPTALFLGGALLVMAISFIGANMGWSVEKRVSVPVMADVTAEDGEPIEVLTWESAGRVKRLVTEEATNEAGETVQVPKPSRVQTAQVDPESGGLLLEQKPETVEVRNLISADGVDWALRTMVDNFTGFAPLGVVLVAMLGIGVAEKTGAIGALLKAMMLLTPDRLLTPATVFIGVMSSMAADAGYVILPPVAAALYKAVGRSPLVGLAAVFAGVSAGFSANLFLTSLDPLLQGLTQEAAQIIDPGYTVNVACNYAFMIVSTFLLTAVGWAVTAWFVEPRYAKKSAAEGGPSEVTEEDHAERHLSPGEWRGLRWALISLVIGGLLAACLILIPGAPLHASEGEAAKWPAAIVPLLAILFLIPGVAYGVSESTITGNTNTKSLDAGIAKMMAQTMADMAPYIVLAFFAAQFIAYFEHSNLGQMLAISGGEALAAASLPSWALISLFIIVVMLGNLFIGSASAKYAIFAPVFIPMFMAEGVNISPELTQAAYRVGDSCSNIIAPLNPYVIILLVFMRKYMPKAGLGTLVSLMLPYAITFWIIWTLMLIAWILIGAPLGPDGGLFYPPNS